VINSLSNDGLDVGLLDQLLIRRVGYPQAGWIDMGREGEITREEFYKRLTTSKAATDILTLIPGETNYFFMKTIAEKFDLNITKLSHLYDSYAPYPDGVIIPESYRIPKGVDEERLIRFLIDNSIKKHKELSMRYLQSFDQKYWFQEIVTKASIVQKEAADTKEMPLIASVIENRLKIDMPLQMDGTLNYSRFSHTKVTPKRIKTDTTKFNTYKFKTLPPYPVCAVSTEAIKAVLTPAKSNYLYFVKGKDGRHIFSKSFREHRKNIERR
jgi:UPF0755 protein